MTVQISVLDNGLRIATDTMSEAESVVVGAWVGVGTRHEPWTANGIAHLTEHMLFKGTKRRSAYALSTAIEKNGGAMNAHTTREETAYYARVLPEDLDLAMDVIADMLQRSVFDPKELDRERQVILQEISRDIDTPEDHVYDLFHEAAFPRQKIGRSILGKAETIAKLPRAKVASYVKDYYHAGNIVIVGTGKIDHDRFVALAQKLFGRLGSGKTPPCERPRIRAGEVRVAKDVEQMHLMLGFPAPSQVARKAQVANVLGILLGGSSSSRLFQKVREQRGLVYSISAGHMPFRDVGLFNIYAGTDPNRVPELLPVVCRELKDVAARILPSELKRAKAQARAEVLMGQESVMRRAEVLGFNMLCFGRPITIERTLAEIEAVNENETQGMAAKIFAHRPILASLGPVDALEPYKDLARRMTDA
jgi:predicted Zn-dependent peptidase